MFSRTCWRHLSIAATCENWPRPLCWTMASGFQGLRLDHPRLLALMHGLVRFSHIAGGETFRTAELYPHVLKTLGCKPEARLVSLRYDLSKLRAKVGRATRSV